MKFIFSTILILFGLTLFAQDKFWVFLSDKDGVEFDPMTYFDAKAIERRLKHDLPLVEESDKPLRTDYFNAVNTLSDTVSGHSRWFNAMAVVVSNESQLHAIQSLPFVTEVVPMVSQSYLAEE